MLASPLTPKIQVEPLPDGVRYHFAAREVGPLRFLGLAPLAVGAALLLAIAGGALVAWRSIAPGPLPAESPDVGASPGSVPWPLLLFGTILGLVLLRLAFTAARFGLIVLAGTGEILLQPGRLTLIDRGGPLFRKERIPVAGFATLRVEPLFGGAPRSRPRGGGLSEPLARLVAVPLSGKVRTLAIGYPAWELEALAEDLALRLPAASLSTDGASAAPPRVERAEGPLGEGPRARAGESAARPPADEEPADAELDRSRAALAPEGSPIAVSRAAGLEVVVPAAGLFRGSHGLATIGLAWLLLTGGLFLALALGGGAEAIPLVMLLVFVAIGALLFFLGARMGLRSTRIALAPPTLRVERTTVGGARIDEIRIEELLGVTTGPSGLEVNGRAVPELKLRVASGREIGLLLERRPEELEWLAALLRDELRSRGFYGAKERSGAR